RPHPTSHSLLAALPIFLDDRLPLLTFGHRVQLAGLVVPDEARIDGVAQQIPRRIGRPRLAARGDEPLLVQILREPLDRLRLRPGEGIEGRSDRLSLLLDLLAVLRVPERSPAGQDRHTLGPSALVRSDGPLGLALSL